MTLYSIPKSRRILSVFYYHASYYQLFVLVLLVSDSMDEKKGDPMVKDGKKLSLDEPLVVVYFFLSVFVALPIALVVLLPLALLAQLIVKILSVFSGKAKGSKQHATAQAVQSAGEYKEGGPNVKRKYDLVIFGSTGFTGKMAAVYLAKQYGTGVRWAIAGRRRAALEDVRKEVTRVDAKLKDLPIVIADSSDLKSLNEMVLSTKVVITTAGGHLLLFGLLSFCLPLTPVPFAGPFDKYGSDLVRLCAGSVLLALQFNIGIVWWSNINAAVIYQRTAHTIATSLARPIG